MPIVDDELVNSRGKAMAMDDNSTAVATNRKKLFGTAAAGLLNARYPTRPVIANGYEYVEPTLAGCAHRVLQGSSYPNGDGTGNIYVGSERAAQPNARSELTNANIRGIVNCTTDIPCFHEERTTPSTPTSMTYCRVAVYDVETADMITFLWGATTFIHSILTNHDVNRNSLRTDDSSSNGSSSSVLVHCRMGISRSATVAIAYLIRYHGLTRDEAYTHVKRMRPQINPNRGFWNQLQTFEKRLTRNEPQSDVLCHPSGVLNTCGSNGVMDIEWCKVSNAIYSTCREIESEEVLWTQMDPRGKLDNVLRSKEKTTDLNRVLVLLLDYTWGRGVLTIDVEWLVFVCHRIDQTQHEQNLDTDETLPSMPDMVQTLLSDNNSEFSRLWCGKIYEGQIRKIVQAFLP